MAFKKRVDFCCCCRLRGAFSPLSQQEEVSRAGRDDRPSVAAILAERKMDSSAVGNHNKVKVMATQLLAKFEENAPAQQTGLKRQVGRSGECLKETRQHNNCVFQPRAITYFVLRGPLRGNVLRNCKVLCCQSSSFLHVEQ